MEFPAIANTARIIDYWLGGCHHFPIDVEAAKAFESIAPDFPEIFRSLRQYNSRVTRYIAEQGIEQFLVFGSGLPTCGNVHEAVPHAKVLYTDIDDENIHLGQQILADNPNADYTFCDASNLDTLDPSIVTQVLGEFERLGIIFIGVAAFIPDAPLAKILDRLYDWSPAGSFLALDFDGDAGIKDKKYAPIIAKLDAMGAHIYFRERSDITPLLGRWKLTQHGILPVEDWQANLSTIPEKIIAPAFMYGCVVAK